jgi:putative membrane protein
MAEEKHDGLKGALDKAQDMVGGMVGMASAAGGSRDAAAFVENACASDLYEIEAARLALSRSRSQAVKDFAAMMVEHHTTAMHQMQSALTSSEVTSRLPGLKPAEALDARRRGLLDHLREAPEDAFDSRYIDQQRMAHQEAIVLHRGYGENGDNPQLQSVAMSGLPMLERHLKRLGRIAAHH